MNNKYVLLPLVLLIVGCQQAAQQKPQSSASIDRKVTSPYELNSSTSRAKRTQYECKIATIPGLKANPVAFDNFRMDMANVGFADLYGDGSLETIAGFSDEPYPTPENDIRHQGNKERSREYSDYMFFSPDPSFKLPSDTSFIMARNIIPSDLNGDNIDDLVMIQHGPDYAPYEPQPNYILLSTPEGYVKKRLPGPKALHHGGAVGDIDGDGDLDIVATPSEHNRVVAYLNDGNGTFKVKTIIGAGREWNQNDRNYNTQLWDIDKDGYLDLILDGHDEYAAIYWGQESSGLFGSLFTSRPTRLKDLKKQVFQDIAFTDIDSDGQEELVFLSSLNLPAAEHFYQGWGIYSIGFNGRNPEPVKVIHETKTPNFYTWYAYLSACDLKNDGDFDLVLLVSGQRYQNNENKVDKVVFDNNDGVLTMHKLKGEMYLGPKKAKSEEALANSLGVTIRGYSPSQVYFPSPNGNQRYLNWQKWPKKDASSKSENLKPLDESKRSAIYSLDGYQEAPMCIGN